jgi:hypothetical protein
MFDKWKKLIQQVWMTNVFWELFRQYCRDQPPGAFFALTWYAVRDKLFMEISRVVTLCEQVANQVNVGSDGQKALAELKALYEKGDLRDYASLDFDDCGVKVFRDKAIAHPANPIKEILGKNPSKISVKWDTLTETIDMIKQFCEIVEQHNLKDWPTTHYLGETGDRRPPGRVGLGGSNLAAVGPGEGALPGCVPVRGDGPLCGHYIEPTSDGFRWAGRWPGAVLPPRRRVMEPAPGSGQQGSVCRYRRGGPAGGNPHAYRRPHGAGLRELWTNDQADKALYDARTGRCPDLEFDPGFAQSANGDAGAAAADDTPSAKRHGRKRRQGHAGEEPV